MTHNFPFAKLNIFSFFFSLPFSHSLTKSFHSLRMWTRSINNYMDLISQLWCVHSWMLNEWWQKQQLWWRRYDGGGKTLIYERFNSLLQFHTHSSLALNSQQHQKGFKEWKERRRKKRWWLCTKEEERWRRIVWERVGNLFEQKHHSFLIFHYK